MSSQKVAVRFLLPTGEKMALHCESHESFFDIKDRIWAKKNMTTSPTDHCVQLINSDVYFADHEFFERMIDLYPLFREDTRSSLMEARIVHLHDVHDKRIRSKKATSENGSFVMQSYLFKRGGSMSHWKKRYFVLESFTLFYFENESAFLSGKQALGMVPMGSCQLKRINDSYKGRPFAFELGAEHLGLRNFVLCASKVEDMVSWMKAVQTVNLRRVKFISVQVIEELTRRGVDKLSGLFRVSGSKEVLWKAKKSYDNADPPSLYTMNDDHAISGLLKLSIRELDNPLLTWELYDEFLEAGERESTARNQRLKTLIESLPASNRNLLQYLMKFLNYVSAFHEENLMTPKNLAIVFGPNILRPEEDSAVSAMQDTGSILKATQALIEHYEEIFEAPENEDVDSDSESVSSLSTPNTSARSLPGMGPQAFEVNEIAAARARLSSSTSTSNVTEEKREEVQQRTRTISRYEKLDNETIDGFVLMMTKKDTEDILAGFSKKLQKRKTKLDDKWSHVSTALTEGGKPSRTLHDSIQSNILSLKKALKEALHQFDEVNRTVDAAVANIAENRKIEEDGRKAKEAAVEASKLKAKPPSKPRRASSIIPPPPPEDDVKMCVAMYDYTGGHRIDELVFSEGAQLQVLDDSDYEGWWEGMLNGKKGFFPANYVQLL